MSVKTLPTKPKLELPGGLMVLTLNVPFIAKLLAPTTLPDASIVTGVVVMAFPVMSLKTATEPAVDTPGPDTSPTPTALIMGLLLKSMDPVGFRDTLPDAVMETFPEPLVTSGVVTLVVAVAVVVLKEAMEPTFFELNEMVVPLVVMEGVDIELTPVKSLELNEMDVPDVVMDGVEIADALTVANPLALPEASIVTGALLISSPVVPSKRAMELFTADTGPPTLPLPAMRALIICFPEKSTAVPAGLITKSPEAVVIDDVWMEVTPVMLPVSEMTTVEFWMRSPVVPSNLTTALSVALTGPATFPPPGRTALIIVLPEKSTLVPEGLITRSPVDVIAEV